jgi:hypothetical protein
MSSDTTTDPPATPDPAARRRFDWLLDDRAHLRAHLRDVESAIRFGQVGPDDAPELVAILNELRADGALSDRERSRVVQVFFALAKAVGSPETRAAAVEALPWIWPGAPGAQSDPEPQ